MQTRATASNGLLVYGLALCVGLSLMFDLMPLAMLGGTGGLWIAPSGDTAQTLTGHLALQNSGWGWPLLAAKTLMPPHTLSIAMTDSNPFMSLLAKLAHTIFGLTHPVNLLGVWLAACWVLQPVAAVYALRGMTPAVKWEGALAAAILSGVFPALLYRINHINLCGHFVLLTAVGLSIRRLRSLKPQDWIAPCLLMTAAVLFHPYLFVYAAALFCAPWLQAAIERRTDAKQAFVCYTVATVLPVALFFALSGTLGAGSKGFGTYSMNLLSPVWPARSLLAPDVAMLDATGGQYEGYNYLGAGCLALLLVALLLVVARRPLLRPWLGLSAVLSCLFLLALSTKVYAGDKLLVSLGIWPWDQLFGSVQSTGRAFWPVGYVLMLAGVATVCNRLPRAVAMAILGAVCVLQWLDTGRLRADAQSFYAGGSADPPPFVLPANARLLRTVPVCVASERAGNVANTLRLAAARAGMTLADIRLSRPPVWFNCEKFLSDGVELPLQPGELRVFLLNSDLPKLRLVALGQMTRCRETPELIACTNGIEPPAGDAVDPGPSLPQVMPSTVLTGPDLRPLLGIGWREDADGVAWSEGPRSTLLFALPTGAASLRLTLSAISRQPGAPRRIGISVGTGDVHMRDLPDLTPTTIDLPVSSDGEGVGRIAFDSDHPVPPGDRDLVAPVNRASLRLMAVELVPPVGSK